MAVASMSLSIVLGTPIIGKPRLKSCNAVVSEPSPPITIRPSTPSSSRVALALSTTSVGIMVFSPLPSLATKCPLFVVPRMVPPCCMIPAVVARSNITNWLGGSSPSNPSRNPMTCQSSFSAALVTPRKTAFSPGQSPPLVSTPILLVNIVPIVLLQSADGPQLPIAHTSPMPGQVIGKRRKYDRPNPISPHQPDEV